MNLKALFRTLARSIAAVCFSALLPLPAVAQQSPYPVKPIHMVVPFGAGSVTDTLARIIAEQDKLQDNSPNPYKGTVKVEVNPGLTSSTAWFLHVTQKQSIKPFIVQMRKKPVFVSQTSQENDDVFNRAEYKFGAEARATSTAKAPFLSAALDGLPVNPHQAHALRAIG